jgi:phosphatidyl-N-methylethanolamine N-methyltransferase
LIFLVAACLLSLERIAYLWVSRRPVSLRTICHSGWGQLLGSPVIAIRRLFYVFKVLQVSTFVAWCYDFGHGSLFVRRGIIPVTIGAALVLVGQGLNLGVFYRLGIFGVFYGNQFGHEIARCREFPFSLFDHPQYIGALSSIWGFFIAMRFPFHDWCLLPALETIYYSVGAWLEN